MALIVNGYGAAQWSSVLGGRWGFEFTVVTPVTVSAFRAEFAARSNPADMYLASLPDLTILAHSEIWPVSGTWIEAAITPVTLPAGDYVLWFESNGLRFHRQYNASAVGAPANMHPNVAWIRAVGGQVGVAPSNTSDFARPINAVVDGVEPEPEEGPGGYPPAPKEAPTFTDASLYRVRSNLSVDVGSVIAATTVQAVEAGISEDFPMDVQLGSTLHQFIEALTPESPSFAYYPSPVQNGEWLNAYEGETNLGRMARVYPRRIFGTVWDLSEETVASWTATEAVSFIFERWAQEHEWFRFAPVPDLRFAQSDGSYSGTLGQLSTDLIGIPQTRTSRQTMREIVDEWLSAFPGAVVTEDETGAIVIVPRDGPDADTSPHKILTDDDAYSITQGPGDPRNTVNGCTVTNKPWAVEEGVSVMQPAWFQIRTAAGRTLTAPGNVLDLTNNTLLGATGRPGLWPLANPDDTLAFGVLSWTDPDTSDLLITGHVRYWDLGVAGIDKTNNTIDDPGDLAFDNVQDLPLDGDWHAVFRLRRVFSWVSSTYDYWVAFDARYDSELGGVQFRTSGSKLFGPFVDGLSWWSQGQASFAVTLDALGNRYGRSVTNSATFNRFSGNLLGVGGVDALQASVEQYGEREAEINISVFNVPVDDLMGIAMAHVLRNINPKIERVIDQSAWNAFPLKFTDAGRLIELPSGEEGILISRSYGDDYGISYSPGTLSSQARIEVLDANAIIADPDPGALDDYLLLDSGEVWSIDHPNPALALLGLTVPSEVN